MNIKGILESKEAIEVLTAQSIPINTAIKISKLQIELNGILDIYQGRRKALFEEYGEGEILTIPDNKQEAFIKLHDELIEEELEIIIEQISVEALGDISISPNHLSALSWLVI